MFLVFKLQRTGSTMFSAVLNAHPNLICKPEFLNQYGDLSKSAQLRTVHQYLCGDTNPECTSTSSESNEVRGLTLNPFKHNLNKSDLAKLIKGLCTDKTDHQPAIVVLTRRNKLKQAVSICRAEQFNWKSSRTQFKTEAELPKKSLFDIGRLEELVTGLEIQTQQIVDWSNSLSSNRCRVDYESFIGHHEATFRRVFNFLSSGNVSDDFDFQAGHLKILSDELRDTVENYAELRSNPKLAEYL